MVKTTTKTTDLSQEGSDQNLDGQFLVPLEDYLKVGIHIGTKFRTKAMSPYVYKVRNDGLSVLNVQKIDEHLRILIDLFLKHDAQDIIVACRRENGWKAVKLFSKLTGIPSFTGRYLPGRLTNTALKTFMETKLVLVVDPFPDRNILTDAHRVGVPVIALCDTNNETRDLEYVIPCNNKGKKSLGLIFWVLAREYLKGKGMISSEKDFKVSIEDFTSE